MSGVFCSDSASKHGVIDAAGEKYLALLLLKCIDWHTSINFFCEELASKHPM